MKNFINKDFASFIDVFRKLNYILSRKQKNLSVIVLVMTVVGAVFETLGVSIIIPLVTSFLSPDQLMENKYIAPVAQALHITTPKQLLILISAAVIAVYILKNIYMLFLSYVRVKFSVKVKRELSIKMMNSYMEREYAFFLGVNTADILRGVGYDVSGVQEILFQLFRIMADGLTAACICIFIVRTDVVMAVSIIFLMGMSLCLLLLLFRSKMKRVGDYYRECTAQVNKYLYEAFQGIKDVVVFHKENYFINKYAVSFTNQQTAEVAKTIAAESPAYFIEAVFVSGLIIVVGLKVMMGSDTATFVPQLSAFAIAAFRILPTIGKISAGFNQLICSCPALNATYENLKEVEAFRQESRVQKKNAGQAEKVFDREIVIKDMQWKYPNSAQYVIRELNLTIQKGKSVALIGESGAGKSTLADILLGLLVPEAGDIEVDGVSIYQMMDSWKATIGYVPQSVFLTDDTIRHNIAFGVDEEDIDEAKVYRAVEKAQLADTIAALPDGLDTLLGERGTRFSGGQRQRVAIARALYNDPDILILDEATAALDNDTENAVMEAIDALQGYKTLVIIAHRLTTIRNCDEIYEIRDGKAYRRDKQEIFS
ncbi:MAG: ABC transporter ATP-binding protein/permease [Ruminococcus flavefaciens]|nr:ABC transporter ATP-binding protein/permease [Ruminococcus flavefaciens]